MIRIPRDAWPALAFIGAMFGLTAWRLVRERRERRGSFLVRLRGGERREVPRL
jgi:hypothetical protein